MPHAAHARPRLRPRWFLRCYPAPRRICRTDRRLPSHSAPPIWILPRSGRLPRRRRLLHRPPACRRGRFSPRIRSPPGIRPRPRPHALFPVRVGVLRPARYPDRPAEPPDFSASDSRFFVSSRVDVGLIGVASSEPGRSSPVFSCAEVDASIFVTPTARRTSLPSLQPSLYPLSSPHPAFHRHPTLTRATVAARRFLAFADSSDSEAAVCSAFADDSALAAADASSVSPDRPGSPASRAEADLAAARSAASSAADPRPCPSPVAVPPREPHQQLRALRARRPALTVDRSTVSRISRVAIARTREIA